MQMITYRLSFIWRGLLYGALAGLVAAEIYVLCLTINLLVVEGFTGLPILALGQIYGIVPSVVVGGVAGLFIGLVFALIGRNLSAKLGAALGLLTASLFLFLTIVGLLRRDGVGLEGLRIDTQDSLFLELPILLLYLVSGVWVGGRLHGGKLHFTSRAKRITGIFSIVVGVGITGVLVFRMVFGYYR